MHFRFTARMILELGAELISSDGIALYELIKNGIDAGSRRVRIDVVVALVRSAFDLLLEEVDTHPGTTAELREAVLDAVGRHSGDRAVVAEAIGPARTREEVRAALVRWYGAANVIRISDTGHGMSLAELSDVFLTVGTRSRLKQRERAVEGDETSPPLGGKGVGRLSTMRLGDALTVTTSRAGEARLNRLSIDWTLFDHASDAMIDEVSVEAAAVDPKDDPSTSGTELVIGGLKGDWSEAKLQQIAGAEFSRLVDPWAARTADKVIRPTFNGELVDIPTIEEGFLGRSHGYCSAEFQTAGDAPVLSGTVDYRVRSKERRFRLSATELVSVTKVASVGLLRSVGPFSMQMWWFNRGLITIKNGYPDATELRREIQRWSGGLMLFRDGYRVNPYGGPEDDWLKLDQAAIKAGGYKINRQQVVGRVLITWRNGRLLDQTNREGLVATPERDALVRLLRHVMLTEFKGFVEVEDKTARAIERTTLETIGERVGSAEVAIRGKLAEIEATLPAAGRAMAKEAGRLVDELVQYVDEAKDLGEQYADDRAQLVYLAGVGLMVEFVLHELDRASTGTLRTIRDLDPAQLGPVAASAVRVLADQLDTLNKRVANLEGLGTVRRQTKSEFDVTELTSRTVTAREGEMRRHGIVVNGNFRDASPWKVKAVPGMFVQIVDNLLANSFYWLKQHALVHDGFSPRVTIDVDRTEGTLTFTDNGPGVDPAMAEQIFQPFVTRKPAGEGRGLGLYISREVATNQGWTVDVSRERDVRPDRLNTFVVNLKGKSIR